MLIPSTGPQDRSIITLNSVVDEAPRSGAAYPEIDFSSSEIDEPSEPPYVRHGKVIFENDGRRFQCSGTIVTSANESLVATAGHCLFDEITHQPNSATSFIPGYEDGSAPFDVWEATHIYTTPQWANESDVRFDIGMMVVEERAGASLQDSFGARGIAFNQGSMPLFDSFGYPAEPPFTGGRLRMCDSSRGYPDPVYRSIAPNAIGCDMNGGSSGGGWVIEVGGDRAVNSVNSYLRGMLPGIIFGPYFGEAAKDLYDYAAGISEGPVPGASTSSTPTPAASPAVHGGSLTLRFVKHLKARITLRSDFPACAARRGVAVYKLFNRRQGSFVNAGMTDASGSVTIRLSDKRGRYFVDAPETSADPQNVCLQVQSRAKRHRH